MGEQARRHARTRVLPETVRIEAETAARRCRACVQDGSPENVISGASPLTSCLVLAVPHPQVEQKYLANIYVDDLPIYGPVGSNDPDSGLSVFVNHK